MLSTGIVFEGQRYFSRDSLASPPAATWADVSRYSNHGTITAGAGGWTRLPSGLWAYQFDGAATVINHGSAAILDNLPLVNHSIVLWVKSTTLGAFVSLINKENWVIQFNQDALRAYNVRVTTYADSRSNAAEISTGIWYFIAVNWDISTLKYSVFKNGTEITYAAQTAGVGAYVSDAASNLLMGNLATRWLAGVEGGARIYNRALSAGQIKQIFEKERRYFGV